MGLIIAAILTGGGLYAVNKIRKRRHDRRSQDPRTSDSQYDSRDVKYPRDSSPANYQNQPSQPQWRKIDIQDEKHGAYTQAPPPFIHLNDDDRPPLPRRYVEKDTRQSAAPPQPYAWEVPNDREYLPDDPPSYAPRRQMSRTIPVNGNHEDYEKPPLRKLRASLSARAERGVDSAVAWMRERSDRKEDRWGK